MEDSKAPVHLARPPRENMLVNLVFNIVIPGFVLSRLSGENALGPVGALLVGMAFPLAYGAYDLVARRKWNFFSIVGFASTSLTGGFALMQLDGFWVAILATAGTDRPLVREFVLNESVIDVARLEQGIAEHGSERPFEALLRTSTYWLAGSFAMSAVLNFVLARVMLTSPSGTPEF